MGQLRRYIKNRFTKYGAPYQEFINKTGSASVEGTLVAPDTATLNGVIIPTVPYDIVGVIAESGVADGSLVKVVTSGVCDVLLVDSSTAGYGGWIRASSDVLGRAINTTGPAGLGALSADDHFKEIGHSIDRVQTGGTNKLCRIVFHPL